MLGTREGVRNAGESLVGGRDTSRAKETKTLAEKAGPEAGSSDVLGS